ncbi:MAG: wax ester/triacylglycerol synthase family O-acyltransferase [Acidimicrobiales bacterium]
MKRLSGLDATFLALETAASPMHVSGIFVADPSTAPGGFSFERYRQMVADRLHLAPPWRRRLAEVPFGIHHPLWIEDPGFDLDFHVRRAALPSPGGRAELAQFAAEFHGLPLDRSRPLWQLYVVEGLEGGRVAVVSKTHHAAIDGVSGAEIAVNLLDLSPEVQRHEPTETWKPDRVPSDAELVAYGLAGLARQPLGAIKALSRTAEMALSLLHRNTHPDVEPPPAPFTAPRTSINTPITPHRRYAMADISLDDVKRVKDVFGCTVNDVVIALCAGALRKHFEECAEVIDVDLVAMVPISVRTEDQRGEMGNKVSAMLTSLATTVEDPGERLEAIVAGTRQAKEQEKAIPADTLSDWTEFMAPAVAARAARLYSSMRVADKVRPPFNVIISNVPGPSTPLYTGGAELEAMYPMGPIADGAGLNITIFSYRGSIHFGVVACRETVPEVDRLAAYLQDSLDELSKTAEERSGDTPAPA